MLIIQGLATRRKHLRLCGGLVLQDKHREDYYRRMRGMDTTTQTLSCAMPALYTRAHARRFVRCPVLPGLAAAVVRLMSCLV